jgi:transposase-like protein
MDGREFQRWLKGLETLTSEQRRCLSTKLEEQVEDSVEETLDLQEEKPVCPHCESEAVIRYGRRNGLQSFKCKACQKRFNRLSGTPLFRLRHKDKWRQAVESIEQKETLSQMQERLSICRDTANRWRHRLLKVLGTAGNPKLSGVVEADETFIRQSNKGQKKGLSRAPRQRGASKNKGLSLDEYSCVWVARDRNKQTAHHVSMHRDVSVLRRFLGPLIQPGSILCTDGKKGYAKFIRQRDGIQHVSLNQSQGQRVKDAVYHIQNANNYHSRLKGWMTSFKGVSTKYLPNYLAWFRYSSGLKEKLFPHNPDKFFKFTENPA